MVAQLFQPCGTQGRRSCGHPPGSPEQVVARLECSLGAILPFTLGDGLQVGVSRLVHLHLAARRTDVARKFVAELPPPTLVGTTTEAMAIANFGGHIADSPVALPSTVSWGWSPEHRREMAAAI